MYPEHRTQETTMVRVFALLALLFPLVIATSAQTTEAELTLEHGSSVRTAAWNAEETRILTAEGAGAIHVWSAEDGERLLTYNEDGNAVTHALWVEDGAAILSADETGLLLLNSSADGAPIHSWETDCIPSLWN